MVHAVGVGLAQLSASGLQGQDGYAGINAAAVDSVKAMEYCGYPADIFLMAGQRFKAEVIIPFAVEILVHGLAVSSEVATGQGSHGGYAAQCVEQRLEGSEDLAGHAHHVEPWTIKDEARQALVAFLVSSA